MRRAAAALLACSALAAHEVGGPVEDLRIHGDLLTTPEVVQRGTLSDGSRGEAEWKGMRSFHIALGVDYVAGAARRGRGDRGIYWGLGGYVSQMNLAPSRYVVDGVSEPVPRPSGGLTFREIGPQAQVGWATRPSDTGFGDWNLEIGVVGRGGLLQGAASGYEVVGSTTVQRQESAWGWWYAGGPKVGAFLADRGWILGLTAEWVFGSGRLDFAHGDEVRVRRNGPGAALVVGFRF